MKHNEVYINHILEAASEINDYIKGLDKNSFINNKLVRAATVRQIQIIGEATKKLSETTKSKYPNVPWKDIAGMRDKIVHDYFGIDYEAVWQTVTIDIPALIKILKGEKN
jgi:uncharacterized protein with HEPN domain